MKFSNIHPASESDFLSGIFSGGNLLLCKFLLLCYFSVVFKPIFLGEEANSRGKVLEGKTAVSGTMYQNTEMNCFQRKPFQILVRYVIVEL